VIYQFSLCRGCTLYPQFVFSLVPGFAKPLNTSEVSGRDSLRGLYKDFLTYNGPLRLQNAVVITLPNKEDAVPGSYLYLKRTKQYPINALPSCPFGKTITS
jgi:hypothetical protein